ncbi:MAG: hypothetical protein ACK559_07960, partial [bacterium]
IAFSLILPKNSNLDSVHSARAFSISKQSRFLLYDMFPKTVTVSPSKYTYDDLANGIIAKN